MQVLAAMSGGVDSAVAAARAAEAGHDVTGIHLALSRNPQSYRTGARGCCTIEDCNDARRAADVIGIPFYVWDLSDRFHEDVVEDFMAEYAAGRTPNPCLRCNEKIKFAAVLDRALALGFDAVATGHYAQLRDRRRRADRDAPGRRPRQGPVLRARRAHPGAARALAVPARRLHEARGPRARPSGAGLLVADKPDSHDICFIADGDTAGWLREKLGAPRPAAATSSTTPPARCSAATRARTASRSASARACGSAGPPPTASRASCSTSSRSPAPSRSGRARSSPSTGSSGIRPRWCGTVPTSRAGHRAAARARRRAPRRGRRVRRRTAVAIELLDPAQGIAPGQAAVVYDGTRVVGSCTIVAASRTAGRRMTLRHRRRVDARRPERPTARLRRGGARRARRAARPAAPARAARPRCARDHDRPGAGRRRRARRRPAAGRLAAHRRAPGIDHRRARSLLAQDLDAVEEQTQGYDRAVQDPGHRPVDAGRHRRAAPRRPGARRPRRPPRARPGARRGPARPRRRRAPPDARAPTCWCRSTSRRCRRCSPAQVPTASGFRRHRSVDPPEASRGPRVGVRRDHRGRRRPRRALLRRRRPGRAAPRRRRRGRLGRPRRARPRGVRRPGRGRSRQGEPVHLGVVPSTAPARPSPTRAVTERVLRLLDMLGLDPERRVAGGHPGLRAGRRRPALGAPRPRPRPPGRPRPRVLTRLGPDSGQSAGSTPRSRHATIRHVAGKSDSPDVLHSGPKRDGRDHAGAVLQWYVRVGQPTWTPSGPSVASSSCLTLRNIQHDQRGAERSSPAPTRNAWVAPSVKTDPGRSVLQRAPSARRSAAVHRAAAPPHRPWRARHRVGEEVHRHRAQRGQAERAADLLHGVQHARADAGVLARRRGARRSGSAARTSCPCRTTSAG